MYKLSFFVPESHLEEVKSALFTEGAGRFKAYEQCCWQVLGVGQFKPLTGSRPFAGNVGELEKLAEYKVEMICEDGHIKAVLETLLCVHPYEEPAYAVYKILTMDDFI